jgi:Asp-tRNA(Asn)/Glu-tRNA(Gln) amidotransferase A subunit family amidase
VLLAKTTMPDYGMLTSGLSSFHHLSRNPWDLRLNPGGSSAGAAAAAAAGYGPLHMGTDIGGSIRLPAGLCGVFGLKPSLGRIPIKPPYAGRVAGPMTRSVADSALMMGPLTRPDWRDTMSLPFQDIAWGELDMDVRGLRLGLLMDAGWGLPVAPEVARHALAAAELLASAGAHVQSMASFTPREMPDGINRFWRFRSWHDISQLPPQRQALVLPFIRAWVAEAAGYDAATVFRGFMQMAALRDAAVAACQPFDYVLSPVCAVSAFPATHAMPSNDPLHAMEHIAFTLPFNMSEQPAISVPCAGAGLHDSTMATGTPAPRVGLQIVGRRHDDLGVLRVARAFEMLRGALPAWPEPPAVATPPR